MRLWLVGCGNMAGAMLRRWIDAGVVAPSDVFVANRADRELPAGVRQGRDLPDGAAPDVVVLGVKPQQLNEAAHRHGERVRAAPILLSMLAGADADVLARAFPGPVPVVCMPNLPVALGRGVVPVLAPTLDDARRATVDRLLAPLGLVLWCDEASRFEAAGALSGTGPAFLFRFVDALASAGVAAGLAVDDAAAVALATVEGAALMAAADPRAPAALADAVASPGGMTRAGFDVLDRDDGIAPLLSDTLAAAISRGRAMAEERRRR